VLENPNKGNGEEKEETKKAGVDYG